MEYTYIGWCREGASDKVWVCIKLNGDRWGGSYVTAWGRRGKKLQHKVFDHANEWDIDKLVRSKSKKGYTGVSEDYLTEVYPEFEMDLKQLAFWATLSV
jgi:predicted DNA-binding WGR domain protein